MILSFHKRLSILTETLWEGFVDIYHWGIVLIMFTCVFSVLFNFLFGSTLEKFSTIWLSFQSLMLMVIGFTGALEQPLEEEDLNGLVWLMVMIYGAAVSLVLINLFLGIVLDAFNIHTKEREESDSFPHSLEIYFYRIFAKNLHWVKRRLGDAKVGAGGLGGDEEEGSTPKLKRRNTDDAMNQFRRQSASMNVRQLHAMPISIKAAKDVLRGEYMSESMICTVLRKIVVQKLCDGKLEVKEKKNSVNASKRAKKKAKTA